MNCAYCAECDLTDVQSGNVPATHHPNENDVPVQLPMNSRVAKHRLYNVYILPILLHGADTWSMTVASSRRLDAFDQWCLGRIVHIPYTAHITNEEVRRRTGQPPVTSVIAKRRLRLSVRTSCESRPITRPLAHSSSSHQSSSSGLATPGRSTKADMAPYDIARPSAP